jgi:hypothetical protein
MRLIIARALTPALATAGIAWAIVLPTLTLGEAKTPSHAFAIPAPSGDLLIEASRLPETATARPAPPTAPRPVPSAPSAPVVVVTAPAPKNVPATRPRSAAPLPTPIQVVPELVPTPTPPPTSAPTPEPAPVPQPSPAPEPSAMRTLASVTVSEQPNEVAETPSKKHKQHNKKIHAEKPKHDESEQCDDPSLPPPQAEPQAAPPATVDALAPVEPLAVETEQHAEQRADGKEGNGKEHDKKK